MARSSRICLLAVLLFWAGQPASAQTLSAAASGGAAPGGTLDVNISFTPGAAPVTGLQFKLVFSSSEVTSVSVAAAGAAVSAQKTVECAGAVTGYTCLVIGNNLNPIPGGLIAVATVTLSPTAPTLITMNWAGLATTSANGDSGSLSAPSVSIPTSAVVSLISLVCTPSSFSAAGPANCTATLSGAAQAGDPPVSISSSHPAVTAPASAPLAAGARTASFSITVGSFTSAGTATITATWNGVSKTAAVTLGAAISQLSCTPANLGSGGAAACTVTLGSAAGSGGTTVALSSNSNLLSVPASVTVPAGATMANFTATAGAVSAAASATITATANGARTFAVALTPGSSISLLACSAATLAAAASADCTITLNSPAGTGGEPVALAVSSTALTLPASVNVPAGSRNATFTITAGQVSADTSLVITATANGAKNFTIVITAPTKAGAPRVSGLSCSAASLVSLETVACSVFVNPAAPASGETVLLTSTNSNLMLPASVNIPAGSSSGSFTAAALGVTANQPAILTAILNGAAQSFTVWVLAPLSSGLAVVCSPSTVPRVAGSSCTVTLSSPAAIGGVTVGISPSSSAISTQNSLHFPGGTTTGSFPIGISGAPNSRPTITVTLGGASASFEISIEPSSQGGGGLSCQPNTLVGGGQSQCLLTFLSPAPAGGALVHLSSSSPLVMVPAFVAAAAGATSISFPAKTDLIDQDRIVTLSAAAEGTTYTAELSLAAIAPVSLACSPKTATTGGAVVCELRMNSPSSPVAVPVALASSSPLVTVPAAGFSALGQSSVFFRPVIGSVSVEETVTFSATLAGRTLTDAITVTPSGPVPSVPAYQMVITGSSLRFTVSAQDPANLAFTLSASGLPAGASFNAATGIFDWAPGHLQFGVYPVRFTATNSLGAADSQIVLVEAVSATPVLTSLENGASFTTSQACSPGAWATLKGSGFARSALIANAVPLPVELNGARLKINDGYAALYFVSTRQVNFQCPALPPGAAFQVRIETGTQISNVLQGVMQSSSPGIFTMSGTGSGQGAILIDGTVKIAAPRSAAAQPAAPGDVIAIYATGLGPVRNGVPPGVPASVEVLAPVEGTVQVRIGGVVADAAFAGLTPGSIGLYQVNVRIPANVPPGNAVPLELLVTDPAGVLRTSNTVTLAIEAQAAP